MRRPPPLPFVAAGVAGAAVHAFMFPLELPLSSAVRGMLHLALFASALVLIVALARAFGPARTAGKLATTGPYRYSRNPIYMTFVLLQITFGVQHNNAWIILFTPAALMVAHFWIVLPEERELAERFGAEYENYRRSVRRYL